MSDLLDLKVKKSLTALEYAVVHYSLWGGSSHMDMADKAASDLKALSSRTEDLAKAVDILAALHEYGAALPDEAYDLIETYHGKL